MPGRGAHSRSASLDRNHQSRFRPKAYRSPSGDKDMYDPSAPILPSAPTFPGADSFNVNPIAMELKLQELADANDPIYNIKAIFGENSWIREVFQPSKRIHTIIHGIKQWDFKVFNLMIVEEVETLVQLVGKLLQEVGLAVNWVESSVASIANNLIRKYSIDLLESTAIQAYNDLYSWFYKDYPRLSSSTTASSTTNMSSDTAYGSEQSKNKFSKAKTFKVNSVGDKSQQSSESTPTLLRSPKPKSNSNKLLKY